ncbi:MAG: dethiobiotin synthase [Gammaproteobacteria bacterium]|jgi:dethiobiotin synthetase
MHSLFVTGTDTEVGKTVVSCALIRQLVAGGLRVAAMKPVASGAQRVDGELRNDDALQLMAAANVELPYALVNPYCFEPAIAPHIAAQQAGVEMSLDKIVSAYQQIARLADVVVVEGAGGWFVPLNASQTWADVAGILELPVMLVVGMRLGCLNHAMLTAHAVQTRGLQLTGWIANILDPSMPELTHNIDTLKRFIMAPHLGVMPFLRDVTAKQDVNFKTPFVD